MFVVLVSSVIWSAEAAPKSSNEEIIKALKEVFLESKDDFIIAQDIEKYFPFTKLIDVNKEERENEFEDINNYDLAWNITQTLAENRGFDWKNETDPIGSFLDEFRDDFSNATRDDKIQSNLLQERLDELSSSWINFLVPSMMIAESNTETIEMIYKRNKLHTALLYKVLIEMRNFKNVEKRSNLLKSLDIPDYLLASKGYMIGYRWELDIKDNMDLQMLMEMPSDVILSMTSENYEKVDIEAKVRSSPSVFLSASQEKQNAWFMKYFEQTGLDLDKLDNLESSSGALLGGASLEFLQEWYQTRLLDGDDSARVYQDRLFLFLRNYTFSRSRVSSHLQPLLSLFNFSVFYRSKSCGRPSAMLPRLTCSLTKPQVLMFLSCWRSRGTTATASPRVWRRSRTPGLLTGKRRSPRPMPPSSAARSSETTMCPPGPETTS